MKKQNNIELACEECAIRKDSTFSTLCSNELSNLTQNKTCNIYKKGQVLLHEGTRPMGVYCINKGKVKIYKIGIDGKEQIIRISKPGDLVGYRAMISEEIYPVSAETLEECIICFIPKTDFLNVLNETPALHNKVLKQVCKELGIMTESLTNLAQKSVRERLAIALLMLKDTYGMDGIDGPVEINLTREDLANIVGTATETLIRLLHDFKEEKLIETEGRKIKIIDPQGLVKAGNLY